MQQILSEKRNQINEICEALNVKKLYVFGSVVTDHFNSESDMDFLLSFLDTITVEEYTNNYFDLHYKLQDLFNRKIDLVTERSLSNPFFIDSVNENKVLLYEA